MSAATRPPSFGTTAALRLYDGAAPPAISAVTPAVVPPGAPSRVLVLGANFGGGGGDGGALGGAEGGPRGAGSGEGGGGGLTCLLDGVSIGAASLLNASAARCELPALDGGAM